MLPSRKNMRLKEYDYSQNGAYFITICSYNKELLFGKIHMIPQHTVGQGFYSCRLSPIGMIIDSEINHLQQRFPQILVDHYVIMPNHVHLLISIVSERQEQSPCPTIGDVVCVLKSITTKRANKKDNTSGRKIWQFRFHDHIIRNNKSYLEIWQYIDTNEAKWMDDRFYVNQPYI